MKLVDKIIDYLTSRFPDVKFTKAESCKPIFKTV